MKALVKPSPVPGAEIRDIAEPNICRGNHVKIGVDAMSICGTDYHVYRWDAWSANRVIPPRVLGHEFAGEVVEVGGDVVGVRVGDRVSGESHWTCGVCLQCRTGQAHVCAETRILGVDVDGSFAEYVVVPEASVWRNPTELDPAIACIQDPLGNAVHAVLAGDVVGQSVAVLGCGPIGLFAIAVARASGAAAVYATDTRPYRLQLARAVGADATLDATSDSIEETMRSLTQGGGVDVSLEMSGAPQAIRQAMRITRRGGRVSLMGIPTRTVELDIGEEMIFKGLDIRCIVGRRLYETWDTMRRLLASGKLDVTPIITHHLSFDDFARGMDLMRDGECGKVILSHSR